MKCGGFPHNHRELGIVEEDMRDNLVQQYRGYDIFSSRLTYEF